MAEPDWQDADRLAADLAAFYGDGEGTPTTAQWQALLSAPVEGAICVVNFVALRGEARYEPGAAEPPCTGLDAFLRYGAASVPRIHAVGGSMTFAGRQDRVFIGTDEAWDAIVVARYPDRRSLLRLFFDPEYRAAFRHRRAAVERYRAVIVAI